MSHTEVWQKTTSIFYKKAASILYPQNGGSMFLQNMHTYQMMELQQRKLQF